MIDPNDQNHSTNVFRVKESTNPLLQKKVLFSLGKRREVAEGASYTIYTVKDLGDKSYKVEGKAGTYVVPKSFDEKYGDLTAKDVDVDAFADIGDAAIQAVETVPVKDAEKGLGKGPEKGLSVVKIPGKGDCFFQSVAYCILADDKFLDTVDFEPWVSEEDLKVKDRKNPMKLSEEWIGRLRQMVSKRATVTMYLHARALALQTLDRKQYVQLMKEADEAVKSDKAGTVYLDDGNWYYVHGKDKSNEQLEERPYPPIWNGSKSEKEWRKEQDADLDAKKKDPDGEGEIVGHKVFLQKCSTFKEFKKFILTSDYWADERALEVLAKELELNILIKDDHYGVNATTGMNQEMTMTIILQRTGQHYNAMYKTGTSKFVFDTSGKIVSKLTNKHGGGDIINNTDTNGAEMGDEEVRDAGEATSVADEASDANAEATPATVEASDANEDANAEANPVTDEASDANAEANEVHADVTSDAGEATANTITPEESADNEDEDTNNFTIIPDSKPEINNPKPSVGGKKRSKKNKVPSSKKSRKVTVDTSPMP